VEEILPVRYCDWITHFGRPAPDKPAVIGLASERRRSCAQFGSPKASDTNHAAL
jgi:hypothetical protein